MLNNYNGFSLLILQLCCTLFASRQWSSWSPFEECSVTCGQGKKIQRRTCRTVDDNSPIDTCIGSRIKESPCVKLICPSVEEPCNCGCNISKENGKIRSRITNKKKANCVWTITTEPHSYIQLQISTIKRGSLLVYISPTNKNPIIVNANDGNLKLPFTIKSDTNWMNISLYYDNLIHPKGGAYFDADFIGKEIVDSQNDGQVNMIVVLGISACAVIILIVIVTVVYRKCQQTTSNKDGTIEDANEDNYSSTSSARSSKLKQTKQTSSDEHNMSLLSTEKRLPFDQTNTPQMNPNNGFVDSRSIFRGVNSEILQSQQQNLMVHPQLLNWQVPTTSYAVNQSTVTYAPQGTIIHEPKIIAYPASHISG